MATSTFFGLRKLTSGDKISDDGYAFSWANIDTIDRLLNKHELALFAAESPIDDPDSPPELEVDTTGGVIPAGKTIRYRYSLVDSTGAETAASPIATISTPAAISRPDSPSLSASATGGTLLAGNYFYVLSAYVDSTTTDSSSGAFAFVSAPAGSTNRITIELPSLPAGADGFNIFRRGPSESQYFYLDSVDMTVATPPDEYIDTGAIVPNWGRSPSAQNSTNSTNSVTITLPGATPSVPDGYTWKLYRSYNGIWSRSLIEWVVTEDDPGIITPVAYDFGGAPMLGVPKAYSNITSGTSRIDVIEDAVDVLELAMDDAQDDIVALNAQHQTWYADDSITTVTDAFATDGNIFTVSPGVYSVEGYLITDAVTGQDFQFRLVGTGVDSLDPQGIVYLNQGSIDVVQDGAVLIEGASPDLVGYHVAGVINTLAAGEVVTFEFEYAQGTEVATPDASSLIRGSWLRLTV